jgi:restriction system protein
MRRRDVLLIDIAAGLALLVLIPVFYLISKPFSLFLIPFFIGTRIAVQKLVYDKNESLTTKSLRRTILNIDPISLDIMFVTVTAALIISIQSTSSMASGMVLAGAMFSRAAAEYLYFSDRPDRWLSIKFRIYSMRRKLHPTTSERMQKILVSEVDTMKGRDFEHYVADLLLINDFKKIKVTKSSGDYGVDITATYEKDKYAFQCKRSESKIGIKAVQEAHLGRDHYKADVAVVVTNNYFTKQAYEAADGKVALWDRERLGGLIRKAQDSLSDEKYDPQTRATETEIRMFAALFDRGKGDAMLTEKVMGTLYPAGNVRSEEDIDHFLRRVSEYLYETRGISNRRLACLMKAIETEKQILPFEADIACYHLSGEHTITLRDMNDVRSKLAKAFLSVRPQAKERPAKDESFAL